MEQILLQPVSAKKLQKGGPQPQVFLAPVITGSNQGTGPPRKKQI